MDGRIEGIGSYPSTSRTKAQEGEVKRDLRDAGWNSAHEEQYRMLLLDIVVLGQEEIEYETELGTHDADNA